MVSQSDQATLRAVSAGRLFSIFDVCLKLLMVSLLVSIVAVEIFLGVLTVLWIILMIQGMRYKPTRLDIPILIYICIRLLSVIFSEHPSISLVAISRELVLYVSYFFTAFYFQHAARTTVTKTIQMLIGSTVVVTIIASVQYLLGETIRASALTGGGRIATHLSFVIIASLVLRNDRRIFPSFAYFAAAFFVFGVGLVLSLTRGDLIAVLVVVAIYALRFNPKILVGLVVLILAAALLLPSIRQRLETLASPLQNTSDRLTLWQNAVTHFGEHPILGFGPETFRVVFDDRVHLADKGIDAWHNDFIQLYIESGLLGVLGWAIVLFFLLTSSVKLIRWNQTAGYGFNIGWIGLLMIIAYLIIGMFGTPTVSITNAILFRFFVAMIAVEYQRSKLPGAQ